MAASGRTAFHSAVLAAAGVSEADAAIVSIADTVVGTTCNLMGIVTRFLAPKKSARGTDYLVVLWLRDASCPKPDSGIAINMFVPNPGAMPTIRAVGDVLLLRNVRIQEHAERKQGLVAHRHSAFAAAGDGSIEAPLVLSHSLRGPIALSAAEAKLLGELRIWFASLPAEDSCPPPTISLDAVYRPGLPEEFNLVCRVVQRDAIGGWERALVWDGHAPDARLGSFTLPTSDASGAVRLADAALLAWPSHESLPGLVVDMECGEWVFIEKATLRPLSADVRRVLFADSSTSEAVRHVLGLTRWSNLLPVRPWHPLVARRLEEARALAAARPAGAGTGGVAGGDGASTGAAGAASVRPAAAASASAAVVISTPFAVHRWREHTSLAAIRDDFGGSADAAPRVFRTCARVLAVYPTTVDAWLVPQCAECGAELLPLGESDVDWQCPACGMSASGPPTYAFLIELTLGDGTAVLPALLCGESASSLLGGVPATDLRQSPHARAQLAATCERLLEPASRLDVCLLRCFDEGEVRRYLVVDTVLAPAAHQGPR